MVNARILLVDDEPDILDSLRRVLRKQKFEVTTANSGEEALESLQKTPVDIVVSDMNMPGMSGIELLAEVAQQYPETVRIILTAHSDYDLILQAINTGRVWSYLHKPWDNQDLVILLNQAVRARDESAERAVLQQMLLRYRQTRKSNFEGFIGDSVVMQFVYSAIEKAAPSNASVFITGPSGAGKEVAAAAIHRLSKRSDKAFMAVNCAAIPSELMESELFGHVKGAFSGAVSNRDGLATLADGGTLFLDELGEMDILLQAKLLRFIQTGEYSRVGSSQVEKADVRFIAATNRDPLQAIEDKQLREDLFYRLNVIGIDLPPLQYRDDDVLQLANAFLREFSEQEEKDFAGFSEAAERLMRDYDWPGNIRQLRNLVHSSVIMADGPLIDDTILRQQLKLDKQPSGHKIHSPAPTRVTDNVVAQSSVQSSSDEIEPLASIERRAIERAIELCEDNVVQAASALGVSPSTLYRKIQQWQQ